MLAALTKSRRNIMSAVKKFKSNPPKIGTHDGTFHCDEILACFLLKQLPDFKESEIVRSRKDEILNECDIVVDVGGVFDPQRRRFDHHQQSFKETFSSLRPEFGSKFDVRLSSAGLIYVHYGEEAIQEIYKKHFNEKLSDNNLKLIYKKLYESLIREIDGIDNGVPMFDGEPKYTISSHLSNRVKRFLPSWEVKNVDYTVQFHKALSYVGEEIVEKLVNYKSWLNARDHVVEAVKNAKEVHESGEILELKTFCPWKDHLQDVEKEFGVENVPKYVLFEDSDSFRVICVPNTPTSFVCRKFLHIDWRGLRDQELQNVSGVDDAVFVHASGFIGGAKSREGALKMAIQSLNGDYCN